MKKITRKKTLKYWLHHDAGVIQAECPKCGKLIDFYGRYGRCCDSEWTIPWWFYLKLKLKLLFH